MAWGDKKAGAIAASKIGAFPYFLLELAISTPRTGATRESCQPAPPGKPWDDRCLLIHHYHWPRTVGADADPACSYEKDRLGRETELALLRATGRARDGTVT